MEKIKTRVLEGRKCKLKKGDWSDDNVICDIVIIFYRGITAYGIIKTSKPLPIKNLISYFKDKTETFEIWLEEPIEDTSGIKVRITNLNHKTKRYATFESCGALNNKDKN